MMLRSMGGKIRAFGILPAWGAAVALAAIGIDKSRRKRAHFGILFLREDLLKIWIVCARVLLYMAEGGYSLYVKCRRLADYFGIAKATVGRISWLAEYGS
jgi:hypothetical protein